MRKCIGLLVALSSIACSDDLGGQSGSGGVGGQPIAGASASGGMGGAASGGAGGAGGIAGASVGGASGAAGLGGQGGAAGTSSGAGGMDQDASIEPLPDGGDGNAPSADDLVAAPDGADAAAGTLAEPTTLTAAMTRIGAGHSIFLRGGTYAYSEQITIERDNSGADGARKTIRAYEGEAVVLDFSSQPYAASGNARGLQIDGSYWHLLGLTVRGSADNGIYVAGNYNIIEGCVTHGNRDTGLQLGRASSASAASEWPSHNLILNCESYDNYDGPPGAGENADGFAAKLTSGDGNVFRGCVAHHNIDDGWDLYTKSDTGPIGAVTIDQCIAYENGTLTDGTSNGNGDRNGFKLGGERIAVGHTVTRSIAFGNGKDGFTWNSNPGAIRLSNTLAFDNAQSNYRFGDNATPTDAVFTNNVSLRTSAAGDDDKHIGSDVEGSNLWSPSALSSLSVTAADFALPLGNPVIARNADGSLDLSAFGLAAGSDLINAGVVPAGTLPFDAAYYKDAPDLGAVETE